MRFCVKQIQLLKPVFVFLLCLISQSLWANEEGSEGHTHTSHIEPFLFIIGAIVIGAATRDWLKKLPFPFTVLLLIIGILFGVGERMNFFTHYGSLDLQPIGDALVWAAHIDPHLLLTVFLPILIFEASFAMDVHVFKKSAINSTLLAVPGILFALFATGAIIMLAVNWDAGFSGWTWPIALMFGAVISATDPVAVVALLKDLGASKKLGTLIEGESLLNDGTAIVLFMVFYLPLTGGDGENGILSFLKVSFGGIMVGLVVAKLILFWLKKVMNDALVEMSLVLAGAYLTYLLAEQILGFSGVLALVSLGLIVGGPGRSSISPKVEYFMHEFWELMGFIANCLIFLIVGVVIATRTVFTVTDFVVLIALYIVIHAIRAGMLAMLFPFMKNIGYGVNKKELSVLWYGALRGAIGLSLALIVSNVPDAYIAPAIKNQFLFYTAGIVTLTLLLNATTIEYLVKKLGLNKVSPAKQQMLSQAHIYLRESSEKYLTKIGKDRYLKKANWEEVADYLPAEMSEVDHENIQRVAELRRRMLEKEKSSYWFQYAEGLIGPSSVHKLSDEINKILDANGLIPLSERGDLEESWEAPGWLLKLRKIPLVKLWVERALLDRLTDSYDSAVGFIHAQDDCLKLLQSMVRSGEMSDLEMQVIEEEIHENKIHGQTFVRNLRKNYVEIYKAISTRQAIRTLLNYERRQIETLQKKGRLDEDEAEKMLKDLKRRIKRLKDNPPTIHKSKFSKTLQHKSVGVISDPQGDGY